MDAIQEDGLYWLMNDQIWFGLVLLSKRWRWDSAAFEWPTRRFDKTCKQGYTSHRVLTGKSCLHPRRKVYFSLSHPSLAHYSLVLLSYGAQNQMILKRRTWCRRQCGQSIRFSGTWRRLKTGLRNNVTPANYATLLPTSPFPTAIKETTCSAITLFPLFFRFSSPLLITLWSLLLLLRSLLWPYQLSLLKTSQMRALLSILLPEV